MGVRSLTLRQKEVLDFIKGFLEAQWRGPTLQEIASHFGVERSSMRDVIGSLIRKGRLQRDEEGDLKLLDREGDSDTAVRIPFYGKVPASPPTEVFPSQESLVLPTRLLGTGSYYSVQAWGSSMTGAGIDDGDTVIVRIQNTAENGQYVVANLNGEATLKEYCQTQQGVFLKPHNPTMPPIVLREGDVLEIQGVVWGWFKKPPYLPPN